MYAFLGPSGSKLWVWRPPAASLQREAESASSPGQAGLSDRILGRLDLQSIPKSGLYAKMKDLKAMMLDTLEVQVKTGTESWSWTTGRSILGSRMASVICMYIYIYVYTYVYIYIYVYIVWYIVYSNNNVQYITYTMYWILFVVCYPSHITCFIPFIVCYIVFYRLCNLAGPVSPDSRLDRAGSPSRTWAELGACWNLPVPKQAT